MGKSETDKFFTTKIERFNVDPRVKPETVQEDFDLIDNFKDKVSKYIYTNIKIQEESDWDIFFQSRVQLFLSQSVLRALYLKEEVAHSLNANNFPAFYSIVKSLMEIPAQLGYLTYMLYENKSGEDIWKELNKLIFGHRGGLTKIERENINILTAFDKLDKVLQNIGMSEAISQEEKEKIKNEKAMRTFYEDICNFGHPNFMAHLPVGALNDEMWKAKTPKTLNSYKYELYGGFYMHHFTVSLSMILLTTGMIVRHPKVDNFSKLNNPRLEI